MTRCKSKILLVMAGLCSGLALCEILLRVLGFSYPIFIQKEDWIGQSLRPNAEGWYRREGAAYVKINSDGLRDYEHRRQKPDNVVRIAVLGDSFAEALQVPVEDTFWLVLEHRLNSCHAFGDKKVEVINFGVSGYGTAQELLMLRHRVWDYSPDWILLAFFTGNDVADNSRKISGGYPRPYFFERNGSLELDTSFLNSPAYRVGSSRAWKAFVFMSDHVRLFQLANLFKDIIRSEQVKPAGAERKQGPQDVTLKDEVYHEPPTPEWSEAWKVTERLLVTMNDETKEKRAQFLLVTLSNSIQVHPDPGVRRRFLQKRRMSDLFYPDRRLMEFAKAHGIEVITLAPAMQAYATKNNVFLHGFVNSELGAGHWNKDGHHLAGELISHYFCSGGPLD